MKPVCVITGGGSGMGRATAKLVCEAGYHVILVGRTAAKLESAEAQTFTAHSALKRNGRPEEIAALYALLLDERLGYLTGTDIVMDGGVIASGVSGLSR